MSYIGQKIRHFRVVDRLAKGGMGDVYTAYDERLQRKVALKALRQEHRPNAEVKARLLREGRILSQLEHPNICRIYDLLEEDDTDVLVLELIEGKNLKKALRQGSLDDAQKMKVAIQVTEALAAAHGQSVIHRDLKPDNVMLTTAGEVKVLDFGLSRTAEEDTTVTVGDPRDLQDLDDAELRAKEERFRRLKTQLGSIMGTVAYMSPEQAQGEPATAASDMYSLGLLLHELFSGQSPYEPNQKLTMMLIKVSQADTLPVAGVDPDLAALIERMKSLAPAARPSAIDVRDRLLRIRDKPRRRRLRLLQVAAMAFLVVIAAVLGLQAHRIAREAERANREAARASQEAEASRQVSQFLIDLFELSDPGKARGNSITAREILDDGAQRITTELAGQPGIQARLMDTIGTVYGNLGLFDQALPLLRQALDRRFDLYGNEHAETAESQTHLAYFYWRQGRFDEAIPLYESSIDTQEKALGGQHPDLAKSLNGLAILYWNQGKYEAAENLYLRSLAIREEVHGEEHPDVAASLDNLAILYKDQQRPDRAEPLFLRSLRVREKLLGEDHPQLASSLNNLGGLYLAQKRFSEAKPLYERAVAIWEVAMGPEHPAVGVGLVNLATIHDELGDRDTARELYDRCLAIFEGALDPEHPYVAFGLAGRGTVLLKEGRFAEAKAPLQRALAIQEKRLGVEHVQVGYRLKELARVFQGLGDTARAEAHLERAQRILSQALGPDHPDVVEEI
ncbi:MAG: serine/threonine-protein kinase [Acidobacteriota bacterium]